MHFSCGETVLFYLRKVLRTHFLNTYNTEDISWKAIGRCLGQLHHTEMFVVTFISNIGSEANKTFAQYNQGPYLKF